MANHTAECTEANAAAERAVLDWRKKWPNACKGCGGWGYSAYSYDPSPSGVSLAAGSMYDVDVCESCCERNICGRCGAALPVDEDGEPQEGPCPACGWNSDDGEPQGEPGCLCPDPLENSIAIALDVDDGDGLPFEF